MGIPHFAWKRNQEVVLGYSSIGSQVWSALILQPRPQTQRCIHVLQQCLKSNSTTPPIRLQFHIVLGGKVVSYCCCQQTDHNWNNEWHYGPKVASDQNFSSGGHASRILTYMYCVSCACTSMESHLPTWQVSCMHTCTCLAVQCIKLNFCSILVSQQGYFCEVCYHYNKKRISWWKRNIQINNGHSTHIGFSSLPNSTFVPMPLL